MRNPGKWLGTSLLPLVAACSSPAAGNFDTSAPPSPTGDDASPGSPPRVEPTFDGGTPPNIDHGCSSPVETDLHAAADTILVGGSSASFGGTGAAWCDGANYAGGFDALNVGVGIGSVGVFRFALPPAIATALASGSGTVQSLQLVLTRAHSASTCSGVCPSACGSLAASPMRSDWTEGPAAFQPYGGADWCRRTSSRSGEPWQTQGATGATDCGGAGAPVPTCQSTENQTPLDSVTMAIDPAAAARWIDPSTGSLSVRVQPSGGAVFTAGSRENASVASAVLRVGSCSM